MKNKFLLCIVFLYMFGSAFVLNVSARDIGTDSESLAQVLPGLTLTWKDDTRVGSDCSATVTGNYPELNVTITAVGARISSRTITLYLKNTSSIDEVEVVYTQDGVSKSAIAKKDQEIELGSVSAEKTQTVSSTIIITKITWTLPNATVSFNAVEGNGVFGHAGETVELGEDGSLTYSATPDSGWAFLGFRMSDGTYRVVNSTLTTGTVTNLTNSIAFTESASGLTPIFVPAGIALFKTTSSWYPYLDEAITVATNGDKLISLTCSGYIYSKNSVTEYTIPSGVSLVLPYQEGVTTISTESADSGFPYANYSEISTTLNTSSSALNPETNVTYTLTVPGNTRIVNKGTIAIGGIISSYSSVAGVTGGAHSNLILESGATLEIGDNAVLSVCGYILGEGEIVVTSSGAEVYQPFVICDFKGGSYVVGVAGKLDSNYGLSDQPSEEYISPFLRYSLRNIQSKLTLGGSSTMYGYCDLYTASNEKHNKCTFAVAGADGILRLNDSASRMIAEYDKDEIATGNTWIGRTHLTVVGGASLGSMTMEINVMLGIGATINTSKIVFPVPYNFSIRLTDGGYTIANPMKLMPGAELIVDTGATLNLTSTLIIYDQLVDSSVVSGSALTRSDGQLGSYPYPKGSTFVFNQNESANFIVNGTFNIQAGAFFGGLIQTDPSATGSSVVTVADNVTLGSTVRNGGVGSYSINVIVTSSTYYFAGATVHTVDAKIYDVGTGAIVTMSAGNTYYGLADSSLKENGYSYDFYGSSANISPTATKTATLSGTYLGGWYTHVDVYYDHTQTEVQKMLYYVTKPDSAEQIELSVDEWDDGTFKYNINNEWTDFTGSAPSVNYVTYRNLSMGTEKTGFVLYSDSARKVKGDIAEEYRLNDYIWLNANFYFGEQITPNTSNLSIKTEGSENKAELVVINNQVYIVMKIYSDDLANEWEFTLTYTDGDLPLSETITLSLADYAQELGSSHNHYELLQAMIEYGAAAKTYFSNGTVDDADVVALPSGLDTTLSSLAGTKGTYNGVSISTAGVEFTFNEQIGMIMHMGLKQDGGDTTFEALGNVVQIGLLVGDASTGKLLSTNTESGYYEDAYILYQSETLSEEHPSYPDIPENSDFSNGTIGTTGWNDLKGLSECKISFDIKSADYDKTFSLRLYVVIQDGDQLKVLYGTQYHYGLGNYIARTYNITSENWEENGYNLNAYKNFMVATWNYREAAAKAFGSN